MTPSREHVLALDLGTTSVRALVVRASGEAVGRATRALTTRFPEPGRVEQSPAEMWQLSRDVVHEALDAAGLAAHDLAGLGVVTQRGTTVAWDGRTLEPLAPAIGWQDRRAAARAAALLQQGVPIHSLASATKLEWWLRHEPRVRRAAETGVLRFGTPDVWLTQCLTGGEAFVTDPSQACCTGLHDARRNEWSPRVLDVLGLDARWLPRLVATDAVVGETPHDVLGASIPVAARAGDQQASTFAQGVLSPGQAKLTLGTSAMLDRHEGKTVPRPRPGTYPLVLWELAREGTAFCLEGTVITAGATVDWMVEVGLLPSASSLDTLARRVTSSDGVVFVPALQGLGTPRFDDAGRGLIGGLTRGTRPEHLARALVEGLAQRCADLCDALGPFDGALRVDGGLAQSDLLLQELADLSGCTLWRAAETETTALGAALLAALGVGLLGNAAEARATLAKPAEILPTLGATERDARRARWQQVLGRVA
jgi:glycerol kinase